MTDSKQIFLVRVGTEQHIGTRDGQEDCVGVSDFLNLKLVTHGGVLGVLADGMGGYAAGKLASETAVSNFIETYTYKTPTEEIRDAMLRALFNANDAILRVPESIEHEGKVGTTLVAAVIHNRQLFWISVGDSRAYLARGDNLVQLTTDHSYATELKRQVAKHSITQKEADEHPEREVLTSFVGVPDLTDIDTNIKPLELEPEDAIILCSDGLYRSLTEDEIFEEITGHPQEIASALVQKVIEKKNSVQDNVSVVVLACSLESDGGNSVEQDDEWKEIDRTAHMVGVLFVASAVLGLLYVYFTFYR